MDRALPKSLLGANPHAELLVRRAVLFVAMLLSGGNLIFPRLPLLVLMILGILMVANPVKLLRPELGRIWALLLIILVVSLVGAETIDPVSTAVRYANFLGALLLIVVYLDMPRSALLRDALPIFLFFAVQSIATPIVARVVPGLFSSFLVDDTVYFTVGYVLFYHETIEGSGFLGFMRANGYFFEPGVFQIYLNLFLYAALFHFRNVKYAALALFAVFATQSTTGLAISCGICGLAGFSYFRRLDVSTTFVGVIFLPLAILPILWFTYQNIVDKLFGGLMGSTSARQFDLLTGLRIIAEHPLFGIGFSQDRFREEFSTFGRGIDTVLGDAALERSLTNGLVYLAVVLGVPIMIVFVYALLRQRIFGNAVVGGGIILVSMLTESLILTPFFCMVAFSGLITPQRAAVPAASRYRPAAARSVMAR